MQEMNIVELIEKNPITRLSDVYNNKLLNKIKDNYIEYLFLLFLYDNALICVFVINNI